MRKTFCESSKLCFWIASTAWPTCYSISKITVFCLQYSTDRASITVRHRDEGSDPGFRKSRAWIASYLAMTDKNIPWTHGSPCFMGIWTSRFRISYCSMIRSSLWYSRSRDEKSTWIFRFWYRWHGPEARWYDPLGWSWADRTSSPLCHRVQIPRKTSEDKSSLDRTLSRTYGNSDASSESGRSECERCCRQTSHAPQLWWAREEVSSSRGLRLHHAGRWGHPGDRLCDHWGPRWIGERSLSTWILSYLFHSTRTRWRKSSDILPEYTLSREDPVTTRDVCRETGIQYRWSRCSTDRTPSRTRMDHGFCLDFSSQSLSWCTSRTRGISGKICE